METAYIVLSLFGAGYLLNKNGKTQRDTYTSKKETLDIDPDLIPYSDMAKHTNLRDHVPANMSSNRFSGQKYNLYPDPMPNARKITQSMNFKDNRKLDNFIGNHNKSFGAKTEQQPLFKPTPDIMYHNMNRQEEDRSRYISSQYLQNETPIQSQQVGPGINVGPDVVSTGGFQQHVRIMPQNLGNYNQLSGRIIQGKAETEQYTQRFESLPENQNPRFFIRSDESFLPTMASVTKNTARPEIHQSDSDIRGLKANNELYIGGAVSYQHNNNLGRSNDIQLRETERGCVNPMLGGAYQGGGQMVYNEPHLYTTNREETYSQPLGIPSQAHIQSSTRNGYHDITTQRGQQQNMGELSNVRGSQQSHTIATGYRSDPTNRGNYAIHGAPVGIQKHGTTELDSAYNITTGREATHQEYTGPINGGVSYQAGMSYQDMVNNEGYSLRSVTDENRVAGPQRSSAINQDPKDIMADIHLKEESNFSREGGVTPSNPMYGSIGNIDVTPNKIELQDDRMDPALVQTQMQENPYRIEGKNASTQNLPIETNALTMENPKDEPVGIPVY